MKNTERKQNNVWTMPSRKRNKGKGRKAKAQPAGAERSPLWLAWARSHENQEAQCNHGCDMLPEPGSPVYRFIEGLFENKSNRDWMRDSGRQHHKVWTDAALRKSTIAVMLRIGTDAILNGRDENEATSIAVAFGVAILSLEHYKGQSGLSIQRDMNIGMALDMNIVMAVLNSGMEAKNLQDGGERDLLRFYAKRISCSCLKKKNSQAKKSLPKIGICDHCKRAKERKFLMDCSRCKRSRYCCRECQVADWPRHKSFCDAMNAVALVKKDFMAMTKTDAV